MAFMMRKKTGAVRDLMPYVSFTPYGFKSRLPESPSRLPFLGKRGTVYTEYETVFYRISPSNISVMTPSKTEETVRRYTEFLTSYHGSEETLTLSCLDAEESLEENREFLKKRIGEEPSLGWVYEAQTPVDKTAEELSREAAAADN